MSTIELVVPMPPDDGPPARLQPAPRRRFEQPIRVALIDNGKPKALQLLNLLCEALDERIPVAGVEIISKGSASRVIDDEEVQQNKATADVAIAALGDCGACSACSLGDAVKLEAAGVPATVVITDVFARHIASFAATLGMPGYHAAIAPHPVYAKDEASLRKIVRSMVEEIAVQLQGDRSALVCS